MFSSTQETQQFCEDCHRFVLARRIRPNHWPHFFFTLFCCGWWAVVWLIIALSGAFQPFRCTRCGSEVSASRGAIWSVLLFPLIMLLFPILLIVLFIVVGGISALVSPERRERPVDRPADVMPKAKDAPGPGGKDVDQKKPDAKDPDPKPGPPRSFKPGDLVTADSDGVRVWLSNTVPVSDEANQLEAEKGPAAADEYEKKANGLRWVRRGADGTVSEATATHSAVRFEDANGFFKFGWVSNTYLKPSEKKVAPKSPERPKDPSKEDLLAQRKVTYVKICAAVDQVQAAALAKFGKKDTIPAKVFIERETTKALDMLAAELGGRATREDLEAIRKEGDAEGWPKK
jgi:hypothetical protein